MSNDDGTASTAFDRRSSLGYQVNHLARAMEQALRRRIEPHGVVPGQFAQLLALYEEEPLTQRELCDRVRIEQATMANTLARMERDGLVSRVPDPADGRRVLITLTARARELREPLTRAAREVNDDAVAGIDPVDAAVVLSAISRMITTLDPARAPSRSRSGRAT